MRCILLKSNGNCGKGIPADAYPLLWPQPVPPVLTAADLKRTVPLTFLRGVGGMLTPDDRHYYLYGLTHLVPPSTSRSKVTTALVSISLLEFFPDGAYGDCSRAVACSGDSVLLLCTNGATALRNLDTGKVYGLEACSIRPMADQEAARMRAYASKVETA